MTIRPRPWLPALVFTLAILVPWAAGQQGFDALECKNCGHVFSIKEGEKVTKCPKCGAAITHVVNFDGSKSSTGASDTEQNPYKKYVFIGAGAILAVAAVLVVVKLVMNKSEAPVKKKKKKKARPVDDDEDE